MYSLCPDALLYSPIPSNGLITVLRNLIPYLEDQARGKGKIETVTDSILPALLARPDVVVWVNRLRPLPKG